MKIGRPWALMVLTLQSSFAQSLQPQLIGSAGQSAGPGGYAVEWSVGEAVIGPFADTAATTHGFHQFEEQPPTPLVPAASGLSGIRLRKSPGAMRILFAEAKARYRIRLFDFEGRKLLELAVSEGQKEIAIPTPDWTAGMVLMRVHDDRGRFLQGFKFTMGGGQ